MRIVIIGGGFGGVACARRLRGGLDPARHEIVLFSRENHMVFHPLLAEVVGSSLNPLDVIAPLRQMLPGVRCRTEEVLDLDLDTSEVIYEGPDGAVGRLPYDHAVVACGNVANLNVVPGMADHAFPLKTSADAILLRAHVMGLLEAAEVCEDPARRRWLLSFIVVGGGYSGVEAAGEINDLVRGTRRFFQNIRAEDISVTLIHSQDQILPEIAPHLRDFARARMERAGVTIRLTSRAREATREGVALQDGGAVKGATTVCTIGTTMAPMVERLQAAKERGRLLTEPDLRLRGRATVWAVGDCAHLVNAYDGKPSPPTGQFALRQGRQAAENILRALQGQPSRPFFFKPLGQLCSIGGHTAVAEMFGLRMAGFLAWLAWRAVYLLKLPTWSRRLKVGFDWAWLILFPRDLSHLRPNLTDRVSHAHFQGGDFVYRAGEPAANFYVIEKGEAEVVRAGPNGAGEAVEAVLGPGAFFGEQALLENQRYAAGVRARGPLDVLVLGRNVFAQMSRSLAPLRDALAQALDRRRVDVWETRPEAYEILRRTSVADLLEPAPQPLLKPTATFREVSQAFAASGHDILFVSGDGVHLEGVIALTDLMRAMNAGARPQTPAAEFMAKNPAAVSTRDTGLVAVGTLRDHMLKWVPVVAAQEGRRIAGCLGAGKILAHVAREMKGLPGAGGAGA